ncbi:MAG: DUF418 domain-containing protein, partial [Planctomycetota bacterium]
RDQGLTTHARGGFRPAGERLITLDALRGFAILGILVPNMFAFAWPMAATVEPGLMGDLPWNGFAHTLNSTAFLGKFMFNFAMLFGAGVVLFDRKTTPADRAPRLGDGWALWYRRCGVLLVIGLLHAYFFWFGDILFTYAVAGLTAVWWIRKLNAPVLIGGGLGLFALGTCLTAGFMLLGVWAVGAGKATEGDLVGQPELEIAGYLGTWLDAFAVRFGTVIFLQFFMLLFMPAIVGIMALGMGLTKAGVLTGERSTRFHAALCVSMLALGVLATASVWMFVNGLDLPVPVGFVWQAIAQFVGLPLAIGYSQIVVLACRSASLRVPIRGLANVGRMALSNYLSHTLICTSMFYGYGLGYFASIPFPHLFGLILAIWVFNFAFSALWLRYFRFGPAEWVWRQMTYLGIRN